MATRIVPKKYLLTRKDRKVLEQFLAGEIGSREAGRLMNVEHQTLHRIITSIARHATIQKTLDAKQLLSNY